MKLKVSVGGIKQFLFEHAEKIVLGVAVLLLGSFAYSAITHQRVPDNRKPEILTNLSNDLSRRIEADGNVLPEDKKPAKVVFVNRAKRASVDLTKYALSSPWDRPPVDSKQKRGEPMLLAFEQPLAASGYNSFALRSTKRGEGNGPFRLVAPPRGGSVRRGGGEGRGVAGEPLAHAAKRAAQRIGNREEQRGVIPDSDAKIEARPWVSFVALVPIKAQMVKYMEAFEHTAMETANDFPNYLRRPMIQVAVVDSGVEVTKENADQLPWKNVDLSPSSSFVKFKKKWQTQGAEVVAPEYVDPRFTMPLGPMVREEWDARAGHPAIPMAEVDLTAGKPAEADDEGEEDAEEESPDKSTDKSTPTVAQSNPDEEEDPFAPIAGGLRRAAAIGNSHIRGGASAVQNPYASMAIQREAGRIGLAPTFEMDTIPEHVLFRFVDFNVEPGKRYTYRVKWVLANPNYKIPGQFLKNSDSAKPETLETPWSDPSPPVIVPHPTDVLAAGMKTRKGAAKTEKPLPHVMLETFDKASGLQVGTEMLAERGGLLNTVAKVDIDDPSTRQIHTLDAVKFETNAVVLDFRGDRPLPSSTSKEKVYPPFELLLLDERGNLVVKSELDDEESCDRLRVAEEESGSTAEPRRGVLDKAGVPKPVVPPKGKVGNRQRAAKAPGSEIPGMKQPYPTKPKDKKEKQPMVED